MIDPPRIGVFGGSFDPVHVGHLILAEQCRECAGLDEVWFVPAARPPHKSALALAPFERRVEMLRLAVAGQPAFRVEDLEQDRPGPSFTVDTLAALHQRRPEVSWSLLLGADCLPDLPTWYQPGRIVELARLLIVNRPGWTVWSAEQLREALGLAPEHQIALDAVEVPPIGIASRDLRRHLAAGRSIRYQVPRAVEIYIAEKHLYQD